MQISVRNASIAQAALRNILDSQISDIQQAGTWKNERVISTKQASEIAVQGRSDKLLNFCANNYLGLSVSYIQVSRFKRIIESDIDFQYLYQILY